MNITDETRLSIRFFSANASLDMSALVRSSGTRSDFDWEQPELESAILGLRQVVADPAFPSWSSLRRAQVHTNLGNALSTVGRPIDALRHREAAIEAIPRFGMALGTRAETLDALAGLIYRARDRRVLVASAADGFRNATDGSARFEANYDPVRARWASRGATLTQWLDENGWPDREPYCAPAED